MLLVFGPTLHSTQMQQGHVFLGSPKAFALVQEFVINTPTTLAQKYWITNGAVHAHWCAVFAQLLVGGVNQGIHVFLVRIR